MLVGVSDGVHAIAYLNENPPPDLLLLDLKMPLMNGFEVLKWVRDRPELKGLPVAVYSSSMLAEDQKFARDLGAAAYFVKSTNWEAFALVLDRRWLSKAKERVISSGEKPNKILVVDDSTDDALSLSQAFTQAGLTYKVVRVGSGQEAISFLTNQAAPELLVLDLKMRSMGGFEVLSWVEKNPRLHGLPVIILSGSDSPKDKALAQELGAKGYIVKSADWLLVTRVLDSQLRQILAVQAKNAKIK